jgi:nucleoside-diphosphate-sugar epimerase
MKILLTGACGLVGGGIRALAGGQHTFVNVDTSEQVLALGGIRGTFADRELIFRAVEGCDAIIHTAGLHGSGYRTVPNDDYIRVNVIGAEYLFAAAVEHGVKRVVCSSSLEVLCGIDWSSSGARRYTSQTPPRPDWAYPMSKLMVEQLGSMYHREHGLEMAQLRYAWVRESSLPLRKIGYGLLARSVALEDVARANLLACTSPHVRDEVLLIGPGAPLDDDDVVRGQEDPWQPLERHWPGCRAVLEAAGFAAPRWRDLWPSCCIEPARRVLGWEPRHTFLALLRELGWTGSPGAAAAAARTVG